MSDSATLWTVAGQAPLSMGFPWQQYWSRKLCPPPEDLLNPGVEPTSLKSPALANGFFTTAGSGPGKGVSVSLSTSGHPDVTGSVYNKTQTFGEQGFHAKTLPSFSLPSALGSTGPRPPDGPWLHNPTVTAHSAFPPAASLTTRCCTTAFCRAALVSTNSPPAPCSPNHKPSNPPEATLPTGQTEP